MHKRNFSTRTRAYTHWQAQCTTTGEVFSGTLRPLAPPRPLSGGSTACRCWIHTCIRTFSALSVRSYRAAPPLPFIPFFPSFFFPPLFSHMCARAHTDMHNAQQRRRSSLAPNVLWRPQDRSLAVARRADAGKYTRAYASTRPSL